jgi:hypothetical protein
MHKIKQNIKQVDLLKIQQKQKQLFSGKAYRCLSLKGRK